ncbi:cell pole-organizing protein PopZ [Bradyrhizobium sp. F1.4.3]|uniref:PopZ family protein n=1 Tax=Bradyrhizobium sp. F1.4.3 TaxID=3156356 RepID=UPI0033935283
MTQPAKVTEPSMEEILASIRRIIADDEAKPPPAEAAKPAPAAPAPKPQAMNDIPPSKVSPAKPAAEKPAPPPPAAKPAAPPPPAPDAGPNNQDDIDALLAGFDEATPAPEVRTPEPEPELEPEPDVLELTDEMAVDSAPTPAPPPPSFRRVEPRDDLEFAEAPPPRPSPSPSYAPVDFEAPPVPPQQPILAQSTVSAVESAFNSLAHTVLSSNARTLEDLVKEMLRPMLKSWLDDNLPGLVERIVKAEIERVSRGGR